jgi:rubrerythrin
MKTTLAKFKCIKCDFLWESNPGPTQCPKCDHLYVKWLNYEQMRKEWDQEDMGA